jgi:small subunit ribosomal protein S6
MATYESTFICSPETPAEKLDELIEKVRKTVENSGGKITVTQQLGRKRLAYPINKFREGTYVYMELEGKGDIISALENLYKVNDVVIRYLTIKAEKKKVIPRPAAQPATPAPAASAEQGQAPQPATPPASEEVKSNE